MGPTRCFTFHFTSNARFYRVVTVLSDHCGAFGAKDRPRIRLEFSVFLLPPGNFDLLMIFSGSYQVGGLVAIWEHLMKEIFHMTCAFRDSRLSLLGGT
jgi:hypothetical protein